MSRIYYFDHAATTKIRGEVLEEMLPFLAENFGNPSASYSIARRERRKVDEARTKIAKAINAESSKEIYFTSGGTESDNLAIKGVAYANSHKGKHIITSKIEHPAVLNTCKALEKQGFEVSYLNVDENGLISLEELESSIKESTILISIMFANNEIGTIQPIREIGEISKRHNVYFHTDAVQGMGNCKIDVKEMNIDLLSMSGHKVYGPKGVGALYVKKGIELQRLQDGGNQEKGKRAGTENVVGIVGLGKAIELAKADLEEYTNRLVMHREYFIVEIKKHISKVKINGHRTKRLAGNINISFEGVVAEELLYELDEKGICVSTASACSTRRKIPIPCPISHRTFNRTSQKHNQNNHGTRNNWGRSRLSNTGINRNRGKIKATIKTSRSIKLASFI